MSHQKRHRIFVAINLPPDIKKVLARYSEKFPDFPAKWEKKENLHITLAFLGDMTDLELGDVCMAAKEVASRYESIDVSLKSIQYGPDQKLPPRMIWAVGEKSPELAALKNDLEIALQEKISHYAPTHKGFSPHVTLARINAMGWRAIEPEERPEIEMPLDLLFTAESIEVMESELAKPFYMGDPMVWVENKRKWFVISKSGEWLMFAGKEKDIEWRIIN